MSTLSPTLTSRGIRLPVLSSFPAPTATTFPSMGFSLAVSGMMMPPLTSSFWVEAPYQDSVVKWHYLHEMSS